MFIEEIKNIKTGGRELRNFGLFVGAVFAALGFLFLFSGRENYDVLLVIGATLVFFGALAPLALYWPYRFWMGFAVVMGWFTSRLILTILFYAVVTPIGFFTRAIGKDFLLLNKPETRSYWHKRDGVFYGKEGLEKQF